MSMATYSIYNLKVINHILFAHPNFVPYILI